MASIFRTATKQAILEIIQEHAVPGRYGLILTEESSEKICEQVVDLFEMTLELRQKVQSNFQLGASTKEEPPHNKKLNFKPENEVFSKAKYTSEIYQNDQKKSYFDEMSHGSLSTDLDKKLPRKRFLLSDDEKKKLSGV